MPAGTFRPSRGGDGYKVDWRGFECLLTAAEAARLAINEVSEKAADLARIEHEWINRTFQTEMSVFTKDAEIEWHHDDQAGTPHVWGEWGVEANPRVSESGKPQKVSTKDVALFLEFGTVKMAPRPWLYPAWDATKVLILPAVVKHYRELATAGGVGIGANAGWRRAMAGF